jgi:hypothetical protein
MAGILVALLVLVVGGVYWLPSIIAFTYEKENRVAIAVLNFFLGWTLIGWVVALVWAVKK